MNTPHVDPRLMRSSLVAAAIGAILLAGGCKTNSAGGDMPSPNPTGNPTGNPLPGTGGSPVPSTPAPAPTTGAPSMPSTSTGTAVPSTSTGTASPLPSSGADAAMGRQASAGSAMPQSGSANGGGSSGTADSGRAQTPEERRGAIDRRLDESLGTFDSEIRKEQERNAQERDARNAANAGTAQTESSDDSNDPDVTLGGGTAGTEGPDKGERASRPGDLKSDRDRKRTEGAGSNGPQGNSGGDAKTEIPDGSDDDVVARRLRKAAENETDPELKEKLWKEYIEYKKNAK